MNSKKYIGMDVHQATISIAVMDSRGNVVMDSVIQGGHNRRFHPGRAGNALGDL
jgi:hypothetical protein